jgi:eukaryotic-like serine/threonine-protein kinase
MRSVREEITKTFSRLTRRGSIHSYSDAARDPVAQRKRREGKQFGSCSVLKLLGAGGMGEVYLALDSRLGRQVALKFLPAHLTAHEATIRRFQQEARTASALNHPNILTIYEVGQIEGEFFIASEYIDGLTLRSAMRHGPFDVTTALDIGAQVLSALVAAHSAGVIHRDVKPTNIMIRPDGYVKVIDFGLAKLTQTSFRDHERTWTRPGSILGTIDYMSPEQARGSEVDHRTDLWSVGIVLYEMLAHKRPFEGHTEKDIILGILDKPVPPIGDTKSFPSGLTDILNRALAKDSAKRYQTAREMLADLHEVSLSLPRSPSRSRPIIFSQRPTVRHWLGLMAVIIVTLTTAAGIWWWGLDGKAIFVPDWFQVESVRQLTFSGRTKMACISPDGRYLAFVVGDPGGLETLYLKQIDQTSEQVKIPARKVEYHGITFSPDSQTIFEVEKDEKLIGKLYPVPLIGDRASTPIVVDIDGPVSFSPSGDEFAFVRYFPDRQQSILELGRTALTGSDAKALISLHDFTILWRVAWAPKGNLIAAFLFNNSDAVNGAGMLDLIDLEGHESRRSLPSWHNIGQPAWTSNAKSVIVAAATRAEGINHAQLREIAANTGETHNITNDVAGYTSATLTRDGHKLATIRLESKASLWISAPNDFKTGQNSPAEAEQHPSLSWSDEKHVIINSHRGGFPNLWLFDISTRNLVGLTKEPYVEQDATPLPGSKAVIFSSNRSGEFHLWTFDPESNRYTQLTFGPGYDETPTISPDGKWIVYTSWVGNSPHLYKILLAGGPRSQIGTRPAYYPEFSPDGKFIACQMQDGSTLHWNITVLPFDQGSEPRVFPNVQMPVRWSRDVSALTTVMTDAKGVSNIWSMPRDGSPSRQLTNFEEQRILIFAWSPRGDRLACIRSNSTGDAVLLQRQKSR